MQMLAGGVCLAVVGLARGEWGRFDPAAVSTRSVVAFLYLWSFGSFLGFTAYIYLLRATTPARAATYAFVNPLVAVLLGWTLAGETLSPRMLVAAAIIVSGVVAIVTGTRPAAKPALNATAPPPLSLPGHAAAAAARGLDEPASARLS
jgi:drug/metabolite transporter (DMT)-like permease